MGTNRIPLIMERLDKIVSEDRKRKFHKRTIVKVCKHTTALRKRKSGRCNEAGSSWG